MEKDVLAKKHGKIIIGNYYLRCFVTGSAKSGYSYSKGYMTLKLTVQTDFPEWVKETTTAFNTNAGNASEFLDFLFDYPHDYTNELSSGSINNTSFVPSAFRITVYGFVTNPTLYINGHEYSVNVEVGTGEYLTIDSVKKTIILTKSNGEQVNCFNLRNKDSYIFEKIPEGDHVVTTSESFSFDITLLEERGEPKWT
jgi:phage-related protein